MGRSVIYGSGETLYSYPHCCNRIDRISIDPAIIEILTIYFNYLYLNYTMTSDRQIPKRYVTISKYLAKHLRHQPERLGLELLPGGWVSVDALLFAASQDEFEISLSDLQQVVLTNDKQRFAFDFSGLLIRANQGHSTEVDLQLTAQIPPATLYHGTPVTAVTSILTTGLQKMSRHHVHLTTDVKIAHQVGARRGNSVIFAVDTHDMANDRHQFYRADNGVWLVDRVPPQYLQLLE
jgi:putative RNA 2'-phosphotransferase